MATEVLGGGSPQVRRRERRKDDERGEPNVKVVANEDEGMRWDEGGADFAGVRGGRRMYSSFSSRQTAKW